MKRKLRADTDEVMHVNSFKVEQRIMKQILSLTTQGQKINLKEILYLNKFRFNGIAK